jgi:hypothetical protein
VAARFNIICHFWNILNSFGKDKTDEVISYTEKYNYWDEENDILLANFGKNFNF